MWKRIFQVLQARHYRAVFIHRWLFPFYPDQKNAYLEKLLRKLNDNICLDMWDAVYLYNPILTPKVLVEVDKLTLVNEHLYSHFNFFKGEKYIWPIGVNLRKYISKKNYELKDEINLIWTGGPGNLIMLQTLSTSLRELSLEHPIALHLIGRESISMKGVKIIHHQWNENTFFQLLNNADIGIYPAVENEENKGKQAMKCLDYMASGLPVVSSPFGISPYCINQENIILALSSEEWKLGINSLINDTYLRKKIGKSARLMVEQYHDVKETYIALKKILFKECVE